MASEEIKQKPVTSATEIGVLLREAEQEERAITGLYCKDVTLSDLRFTGLRLRRVVFENCVFENCHFPQIDIADGILRACDLSGSDWRESFLKGNIHRLQGNGNKLCGKPI